MNAISNIPVISISRSPFAVVAIDSVRLRLSPMAAAGSERECSVLDGDGKRSGKNSKKRSKNALA